jgi:chorismate mutase
MQTSKYVENKINRLPLGFVFTYKMFITDVHRKEAVIKHLNRLASSLKLRKVSKGRFFKPETNKFGWYSPLEYEIVKDLLHKKGKLTGYITGYSYFNEVGLCLMPMHIIQISSNYPRTAIKRMHIKIEFLKQDNTVTKQNIHLLQLLDAIRLIKQIPDTTIDKSVFKLMKMIIQLNESELKTISRLVLKYNPLTRALLGALLERTNFIEHLDKLRQSLNPISSYKLNVSEKILSTAKYWNIQCLNH